MAEDARAELQRAWELSYRDPVAARGIVYHAAGEMQRARAMAQFILDHQHELVPGALS